MLLYKESANEACCSWIRYRCSRLSNDFDSTTGLSIMRPELVGIIAMVTVLAFVLVFIMGVAVGRCP